VTASLKDAVDRAVAAGGGADEILRAAREWMELSEASRLCNHGEGDEIQSRKATA
jgi:hypothetical protein